MKNKKFYLFYGTGISVIFILSVIIIIRYFNYFKIPGNVSIFSSIFLFISILVIVDISIRGYNNKNEWVRTELESYTPIFLFFLFFLLSLWFMGEDKLRTYLYLLISFLWIIVTLISIKTLDTKLSFHRNSYILYTKYAVKKDYFKKIKDLLKEHKKIEIIEKGYFEKILQLIKHPKKNQIDYKIRIPTEDIEIHVVYSGIVISSSSKNKDFTKIMNLIDKNIPNYNV